MKIIILHLTIFAVCLQAQVEIVLPDSINILVNNEIFVQYESWYDSLKSETQMNDLFYQIGFRQSKGRLSQTKLRIPQTFTFNRLIRQVIMYYSLLGDDTERENDTVLIYPYFANIDDPEFVKCVYSNNSYNFTNKKWKTIKIHSPPSPEEKFIYNQILKFSMENTLTFQEIPEKAIIEVSEIQQLSFKKVYQIYKKVVLWKSVNHE